MFFVPSLEALFAAGFDGAEEDLGAAFLLPKRLGKPMVIGYKSNF